MMVTKMIDDFSLADERNYNVTNRKRIQKEQKGSFFFKISLGEEHIF